MCLTCIKGTDRGKNISDPKKTLFWDLKNGKTIPMKGTVHGLDNQIYEITDEFRNEMAENALALISTGVDFSLYIWAIQWPNDYTVQHFPQHPLTN